MWMALAVVGGIGTILSMLMCMVAFIDDDFEDRRWMPAIVCAIFIALLAGAAAQVDRIERANPPAEKVTK